MLVDWLCAALYEIQPTTYLLTSRWCRSSVIKVRCWISYNAAHSPFFIYSMKLLLLGPLQSSVKIIIAGCKYETAVSKNKTFHIHSYGISKLWPSRDQNSISIRQLVDYTYYLPLSSLELQRCFKTFKKCRENPIWQSLVILTYPLNAGGWASRLLLLHWPKLLPLWFWTFHFCCKSRVAKTSWLTTWQSSTDENKIIFPTLCFLRGHY